MKGYAIKDIYGGVGFDIKGRFLNNFLRCLPKEDPIFKHIPAPIKIKKEDKDELPTHSS